MPSTDPPQRPTLSALEAGRGSTSQVDGRPAALPPPATFAGSRELSALGEPDDRRRSRVAPAALLVSILVALAAVGLAVLPLLGEINAHDSTVVAAPPAEVPVLTPPARSSGRAPARIPATWPFAPPQSLRRPRPGELTSTAPQKLTSTGPGTPTSTLYADGLVCSVGCRPIGAVDAWPLRPFHRQHPLRAGLNELRGSGFHVGIDIQAPDGSPVYALAPGYLRVLAASGPDARVQVGRYIYWHVHPGLAEGSYVAPLSRPVGTVLRGFGHLHLSEVYGTGSYLNPLRPGGRVLTPYVDDAPPVLAHPRVDASGNVQVGAFDPQSFTARSTYQTPVLAPAGLAYRLYDAHGTPVTPLEWALRGTRQLPPADVSLVYAADSGAPGYDCFAARSVCVPHWDYRLAGGLASTLPLGLPVGAYRLTAYAFDWAGNASAIDERLHLSATGWEPLGRLEAAMAPITGRRGAGGEAAGSGSMETRRLGYGRNGRLGSETQTGSGRSAAPTSSSR